MKQKRFQSSFDFERITITDLLKPLDQVARNMERKWGIGTLPNLVPHALAERFAKAQVNLNAAIQANNVALVKEKAANLKLGWELLDQAAVKQGHRPQDRQQPLVWYHRGPHNQNYAFVREQQDLEAVDQGDCECAWTLDEICRIIEWYRNQQNMDKVIYIKKTFPLSEVNEIRDQPIPNDWDAHAPKSDDIPF